MNLLKKIVVLLLLLWVAETLGQEIELSVSDKKAVKYFRQAEQSYRANDYEESIKNIDKALERVPDFIEALLLKGYIFADLGENDKAIKILEDVVNIDSAFFTPVWALLGGLYYEVGDYNKSVYSYKHFLNSDGIPEKRKKTVKKLLQVSEKAVEILKENENVKITRLSSKVNTSADEYVNYVQASDGILIFTRKEKFYDKTYKRNIVKESFYSCIPGDTTKESVKKWSAPWMEGRNVGSLSFSADGKIMYFAGCGWSNGLGSCDIYMSKKKGEEWQEPVNLGRGINTSGWESQPVVTPDEKYLFFASRRKGGKGGSDIWMSVKLKNGKWSAPVNLGDSINTPGNEMAPFLYADNKTLVFSSDGWPSLGGKDIFISRKDKAGVWSKAENVGVPVNSRFNEINFVYSLDGKTAWISSDRKNQGYDIFKLPVYQKIKPSKILYVDGLVVDAEDGNFIKSSIILTDLETGKEVDSTFTNNSSGSFLIVINRPGDYGFNIFAEGYLPYSESILFNDSLFKNWSLKKTFKLKRTKKGESFVLRNIYFDVDRYELNPKSFSELDKLIRYLKNNKNLIINIIGHTDNSGSKNYNLQLSEKRAFSVYNYLVNHGISPDRLSYKGMGDSKPLVPNESPENKAINRRVEFLIK